MFYIYITTSFLFQGREKIFLNFTTRTLRWIQIIYQARAQNVFILNVFIARSLLKLMNNQFLDTTQKIVDVTFVIQNKNYTSWVKKFLYKFSLE